MISAKPSLPEPDAHIKVVYIYKIYFIFLDLDPYLPKFSQVYIEQSNLCSVKLTQNLLGLNATKAHMLRHQAYAFIVRVLRRQRY
jgi:hypothetical protein